MPANGHACKQGFLWRGIFIHARLQVDLQVVRSQDEFFGFAVLVLKAIRWNGIHVVIGQKGIVLILEVLAFSGDLVRGDQGESLIHSYLSPAIPRPSQSITLVDAVAIRVRKRILKQTGGVTDAEDGATREHIPRAYPPPDLPPIRNQVKGLQMCKSIRTP